MIKWVFGAQNSLLKTLEEPPQYITIILLVENENEILNTIKSRCTKIIFTEEIKESMSEQEKNIYIELEKIFRNIDNYSLLDVLNNIDILYKGEKDIFMILEYINILLLKYSKDNYLYTNCIKIVENVKKRLKQNANYDMCIDELVVNMWEEVNWKI